MFNGIIQKTGKIKKIKKNLNNCSLEIFSLLPLSKKEIGASISCSGTCLTLESYNKKISKFFISKETIRRTIFKNSKKGDIINLEKSLKYGDRVSGHFVQGHIDTTAKVKKINKVGKSIILEIAIPNHFKKYIVYKGSITINGISLTVSKILKKSFQIAVVPHTLKFTNLFYLKKNSIVNIEFDILGKYIKNFFK